MTRDEIMALEAGAETDALVAQALGWTQLKVMPWIAPRGIAPGDINNTEIPRFTSNVGAAYRAEETLDPPSQREFGDNLSAITRDGLGMTVHWRLAHASPLERCKALLLTLALDDVSP